MQKVKRLSPKQAIKQFCRECNGENPKGGHYYDCLGRNCPLYPFKEGKGNYEPDTEQYVPKEHIEWLKQNGKGVQKSKEISEEAKQKFSERMKKAWETRKKNNLTKDNQMKVHISHYKPVEIMGKLFPIRVCSRNVGEVFTDSYGTQYQVQND